MIDGQGIETVIMFPTFGCGVEEALKDDVGATMASLHAFNLWLDEDWGFDRDDHRIVTAPMISLADPEKAVAEVDFVLGRGARLVHVRPAPVPGARCPVPGRIAHSGTRRTIRSGPGSPRRMSRWHSTWARLLSALR